MKRNLMMVVCAVLSVGAYAGPETRTSVSVSGAYYFPNHDGYGRDGGFSPVDYSIIRKEALLPYLDTSLDPGDEIGSSWGAAELKATLSHSRTYGFLQQDNALMRNNFLAFEVAGELSPVSMNASAAMVFSPLAFLEFETEIKAGTGWNIGFNGLGRNLPGPENDSSRAEPFSGLVFSARQSAMVKFDFGAVFPGKWTHVLVAAKGGVEYKAYTNAGRDEAWQYEADGGDNFNGTKYYGTYILGYQLPLLLETAGFMVETEQWIDHNADRSTLSENGWGSDFILYTFGPFFKIRTGDSSDCTVLVQFRNGVDYSDETIGYRYFGYRQSEGTYWYFRRIAFKYSVEL